MNKTLRKLLPFFVLVVCSTAQTVKPLTNRDVTEMVDSGLGADVVIAKIKSSRCDFDTSKEELIRLKAAKVSDPILLAMMNCSGSSTGPDSSVIVGPRKAISMVGQQINQIPDRSYYRVDYDKFKDESYVTLSLDLTPRSRSVLDESVTFKWMFISTFGGEGISQKASIRGLCATSSSSDWRFLKNKELILLIGDQRIRLGDGSYDPSISTVPWGGVEVAERLCWVLTEEQFRNVVIAPTVEFQLGTMESLISTDKMKLFPAYLDLLDLSSKPKPRALASFTISDAAGKRRVFIKTSDSPSEIAIRDELTKRGFQTLQSRDDAEIVIEYGVDKTEQVVSIFGPVEVVTSRITVYTRKEGNEGLIFSKSERAYRGLEKTAKNLVGDFVKELTKAEKASSK